MRTSDRIVVATRASRLALTQTRLVIDRITAAHPGLTVEIVEVTTEGDRDSRPFAAIGGKGIFTSEVQRAVVEGRADIAIHSAKDLTADLGPGCDILCVPQRADRADVVLGGSGGTGEERLLSLRTGARVGTSSMRRRALLGELRPDLEAVEFRGNLDTRIAKVAGGAVDAAIVAAAGLERLGDVDADAGVLQPDRWVPAPGQGVLAVEAMSDRDDLRALLAKVNDAASAIELAAERAFARRLEGGCSVPLGCSATVSGDGVSVIGYLGGSGGRSIRRSAAGARGDASAIGIGLADDVLAAGGNEVLAALDAVDTPTVEEP
ncbi:MAG TPA: hydroxymethylbilane synthase [Actinomycetota bacterium]|nr:hydroxymethylbilane synthase [Actinomycetota bacterium]